VLKKKRSVVTTELEVLESTSELVITTDNDYPEWIILEEKITEKVREVFISRDTGEVIFYGEPFIEEPYRPVVLDHGEYHGQVGILLDIGIPDIVTSNMVRNVIKGIICKYSSEDIIVKEYFTKVMKFNNGKIPIIIRYNNDNLVFKFVAKELID